MRQVETAVYSFWSAPYLQSVHKSFAGFPTAQDFATCFKVSIRFARKSFNRVILVSDQKGIQILTELGVIAFVDEVIDSLDVCRVEGIPADIWAYGKLVAYSVVNEPFIHLDYDVIIKNRLSARMLGARIIAQSLEPFSLSFGDWYIRGAKRLRMYRNNSLFLAVQDEDFKYHYAHCLGIVGGTDYEIMKAYAKEAMLFVKSNLDEILKLDKFSISELNVCFEQLYFSLFMEREQVFVTPLVRGNIFAKFNTERQEAGYIHLLGQSKGNPDTNVKIKKLLDSM